MKLLTNISALSLILAGSAHATNVPIADSFALFALGAVGLMALLRRR